MTFPRKRPSLEQEKEIICSEVSYLISAGYRLEEKRLILSGLNEAIRHCDPGQWLFWAGLPLDEVIDDLIRFGEDDVDANERD